ncbi:hypothetical protein J2Y55_005282 [Bosea sp. BE125]|uniref:hypothetical protein n=1 Tax=Bosea sp. BE125 TaxID=2817909 RepID=UPI002864A76C|nr:hypothetical protein [Bosea sp. BE125]MDR6874249.1 hypothetical protein [Bosea sp. BE125]
MRVHLPGMPAFAPLLARLRCSALGAWLAVAYTLAVLAAGLAPSAALAHPGLDGALLCSGLSAPGPDAPEPAGELTHCKGCPVNPVIAGPAPTLHGMIVRLAVRAPAVRTIIPAPPRMAAFGLPQSRAPPAAALLRL